MGTRTGGRTAEHDDGPLELYFEDIRRHRLLSRDEEVELGRKIQAGNPMAVDQLVRANLRFVVSVAKRYQNLGVPLPDLIAEGNVGLVRAAHMFDPERGVKFISYAVWWIRQAILRSLDDHSRTARRTTPLDEPLFDDDEGSLTEFLEDPDAPDPLERTLDVVRSREILRAISTLEPREARVLRLYYGLDGDQPLTLEEIGSIFGLSRERIRQIKERALGRLRRTRRRLRLEPYLV
ncbi:MAG TPA: RNA polymerase sigma factor RpoD/SigA [Gemmatimonadota bacterium]|nr:RNA polymerase sigma factor RpoD/SigA [Gemmatimonadota bacterium]